MNKIETGLVLELLCWSHFDLAGISTNLGVVILGVFLVFS